MNNICTICGWQGIPGLIKGAGKCKAHWNNAVYGTPMLTNEPDYGYLQHGEGTSGPFRTERVRVKHEYADKWIVWFECKWRMVHIQVHRTFIVYRGEKITIQIEGV